MTLTQISTAGVKDDAVTAGKIPANAVGSSELADNAVDTAAIADDAVTNAKLADNAVQGAIIAGGGIGSGKLAADSVSNTNIIDGNVTSSELATNAVTTAKITDGSVTNDKIAGSTITSAKIANNTIVDADINSSAAIGRSKIDTIISGNVNNRVITGTDTANLVQGESNFTYDGSKLQLNDSSLSQFVQSYGANNRFKTLAGSNFLQMITQNDVSLQFRYATNTGSGSEIARVNANGISFSGSNAAAESLDDYEEGTYTPALTAQFGGTATLHSGISTLNYVKIGKTVTISGRINITGFSGTHGGLQISLPFHTSSGNGGQADYAHIMLNTHGMNLNDNTVQVFAEAGANVNTMMVMQMMDSSVHNNGNWLSFNTNQLNNNSNEYIGFVGSYKSA